MGKFISIPGMNYAGERWRERPAHPGASEFYASRSETSHDTTGLVGEKFLFRGEPAVGLHEERNHDGTVDLILQKSSAHDSGTYRMRWSPGMGPREMRSGEVKRIFE